MEWTLYFKNTGTNDTPILENIQALSLALERGTNGEFLLHHNVGSPADGNDYGPLETPLGPKANQTHRRRRRPPHQLRLVLLQPRMAWARA